jgi:hypothetical protein
LEPGRGYSITVDNNNKRIGEANEVKNQKIKVEENKKTKKPKRYDGGIYHYEGGKWTSRWAGKSNSGGGSFFLRPISKKIKHRQEKIIYF